MVVSTVLRQGFLATATLTFLSQLAWSAPILTGFNLVVGGNVTSSSEVEGRTLIGGDLAGPASNYGIALTPRSAFADIDTLIVGGNITALNVNVAAGDVRVGGNVAGSVNRNGVGSDLVQNDTGVAGTVTSVIAQLHSLSGYFAGLATNSTVTNPDGPSAVTFTPTGTDRVAVFNINSAVFSDPHSQQFDLDMGASAGMDMMIVNVVGTSVNFSQGNFIGAFGDSAIRPYLVWNFVNAEIINLDQAWVGALMAPYASLRSSASIDGSVFVGGDFDQRGEVHLPLFGGSSEDSPVPEPATGGLISISLLGVALWKRQSVLHNRA